MSKEKATQRINTTGKISQSTSPLTFIFVGVVLIVVVGSVIWFVAKKEVSIEPVNTVITPENIEEVIDNLDEKERIPVGSYEINMNNKWTFPDGDSASTDAYVANSVNNLYTVYFTISPSGSEEIIYTSPYLPLGSTLDNIVLEKSLDAGVYNTVLTYHLVDNSYEELSSVSVALTITIEN